MTIVMPETTGSFGNESLVILSAKPADLAAITPTELAAGENVTCHMVGNWLPTASVDKPARQRKMCQTKTTPALGVSTYDTPALQYTANPQAVGTAGAPGNEAYEALPEGATRYAVVRLGKGGRTALAADDAYQVFPIDLGPQVWGVSSDDAGGEFVINQEVAFADGYDGPVDGIVAAA